MAGICAGSGGNGESRKLFYAVEWCLGELWGAGEDPPQLIHAADRGRGCVLLPHLPEVRAHSAGNPALLMEGPG